MTSHFVFPHGATPIQDCSGLIPTWVHTLKDLNRVEAENILKAQRKYLTPPIGNPKIWFNARELKNIHHAMFKHVWKWAGQYRRSITSIGIHPGLIPSQLYTLCADVASWIDYPVELTFLEMAARIHHRLVAIHPFENGNGRFSRLISDRFLMAFKCPHPLWPHAFNEEGILRLNYIHTLKDADQGDYEPLIQLMHQLGARDPSSKQFSTDTSYQKYLSTERKAALLQTLLKQEHSLPKVP